MINFPRITIKKIVDKLGADLVLQVQHIARSSFILVQCNCFIKLRLWSIIEGNYTVRYLKNATAFFILVLISSHFIFQTGARYVVSSIFIFVAQGFMKIRKKPLYFII